jgi:alpha-tubulin suppressor-like RCC1 family protein
MIEKCVVKELCFKKIIDLTYGMYHYIAKIVDNKIYCWGNNYLGQMGNGKRDNSTLSFNKPELNAYLSELNIISIKCGISHSIALTTNGEVYEWGQMKNKSSNGPILIPIKVEGFWEEFVTEI